MPTPFTRCTRALNADGFNCSALAILLTAFLLAGWLAWFTLAEVALDETTEAARLEVERAVHPIA